MDLLENAVQSIQVGVEDYGVASSPRLLSAARNIHAGNLLLFKEALHRLSPADSNDALIMSNIVPDEGRKRKHCVRWSRKEHGENGRNTRALQVAFNYNRLETVRENQSG